MEHLLFRKNTYYFNRRVPVKFREYEPRKLVRYSLKTDSKKQAIKLANMDNAKLETYWQGLLQTGNKHSHEHFTAVVKRSRLLGFPYQPLKQLAPGPLDEIIKRLLFVDAPEILPKQVEAVLGAVEEPAVRLSDVLPKFVELTAEVKLNKSANQYRKWYNPRKLAVKNFIRCLTDKPLKELNREDMLKYRDWWMGRFEADSIKQGTANKHLIYLNTMIARVSEHYKLGLDVKHLFHRLSFHDDSETRPPFTTDHIVNVLLKPENLAGMNEQYRAMLEVFAETGVLIAEQVAVQPEDIFLNDAIPHIVIKPRKKCNLKTKYRKRVMPLTGYALAAFKKFPNGFSNLSENPDNITSAVGKYLSENKLLPSERHSTYSLRHSFQDRLTAIDCPDRIQADLMGHKFQRPTYGEGGTLAKKFEWVKKVALLKLETP